jgi:hypothetical protein
MEMNTRTRDWKIVFAALILGFSALYFAFIWLSYGEAWLHSEQIKAAVYVLTPNTQSYGELLRKAFDWAALDTPDPTHWREYAPAQRVRPLSDLALVIDAMARPAISRWLYVHPSLTPSSVLVAILAPFFFFRFLRLITKSDVAAVAFTALWLSSMGFLSVVVPDIHSAAKRLAILSLCVCLFLAESYRQNNKQPTFWLLMATLFFSLFTDEMALGGYVAICGLYAPSFLRSHYRWKALVVLALPVLYVAATTWGLPAMYGLASAEGTPAFGAIGDSKKLSLLLHLGHWDFYTFGLLQTATGILITLGISAPSIYTEIAALAVFAGCTTWLIWVRSRQSFGGRTSYGLVVSALVLVANGLYLTLLDLYPPEIYPPGQYPAGGTSYLASYTYYYHSSLSVLFVVWLAFACRAIMDWAGERVRIVALLAFAGLSASLVVTALNFRSFHNINQLVSLVHYYPFQPSLLYKEIDSIRPRVASSAKGEEISVNFHNDCPLVIRQFDRIFTASMGDTWQTNPFNKYFQKFSFTKLDLEYLLNVYFPRNKFDVQISDDGTGCGQPRLLPSPTGGPPGVRVLLSGSGFKAHTEVDFFWGSAGGLRLGSTLADALGTFADVPVDIPFHQPSIYNIFASSYTGLAQNTFTIATAPVPHAWATPDHAPPGGQITIAGSGFTVGADFVVRWNDPDGAPIASTMGDASGRLRDTLAIVPAVPAGDYVLYVTRDRVGGFAVPFTVASPDTEDTRKPSQKPGTH